jgi:hypothetical protein
MKNLSHEEQFHAFLLSRLVQPSYRGVLLRKTPK